VRAEILVFVPIGKDEQEALAHRDSLFAARAKEGTGFKLLVGRLGFRRRRRTSLG
jgi:hypothetical protein